MTGPGPSSPVPSVAGADRTPEDRGVARDGIRLLVSEPTGESHRSFSDLPELLEPGDLVVVNESATLAASLPARARGADFRVSVSTAYGGDIWLVEPRRSFAIPGPVPLAPGDALELGGVPARYLAPYPGIRRLGFVRVDGDLRAAMSSLGEPIRYGYLARSYPLGTYQTAFARWPGSAEMPSAARPFTPHLVDRLRAAGIGFASIVLHCGVSSLEAGDAGPSVPPVFPEPFDVPPATVVAIRATRARGGTGPRPRDDRGPGARVGDRRLRATTGARVHPGLSPSRPSDAVRGRAAHGLPRVQLDPSRPARIPGRPRPDRPGLSGRVHGGLPRPRVRRQPPDPAGPRANVGRGLTERAIYFDGPASPARARSV